MTSHILSEQEAHNTIQSSPIFHNHWSTKCSTWFQLWRDIYSSEPQSLLNVGVGPDGGNSTVNWMQFWKQMFPSINHIEHLELDEKNAKASKVSEKITIGDIVNAHRIYSYKEFDVLFWCQGPEHIYRREWQETFSNLEKIAHILVLQCPWGSGYDYDQWHYSKSIRKGEFERFGFTTLYNGKEDTKDAGIIAYKSCA